MAANTATGCFASCLGFIGQSILSIIICVALLAVCNVITDVEKAKELATVAHESQVDKSGVAYILHPMRVASRMGTPEEAVVAWLHDVVEDSDVMLTRIREMFGDDTADAVDAITHRKNESWTDYLTRVKANKIATAVKISDLIDNSNLSRLSNVTLTDVERQAKYNRALTLLMTEEV